MRHVAKCCELDRVPEVAEQLRAREEEVEARDELLREQDAALRAAHAEAYALRSEVATQNAKSQPLRKITFDSAFPA